MRITKELLTYDTVDSQGDTFAPGCFGEIDGKQVPILIGFDPRRIIGSATLHASENGIVAEFDSEAAAAAGVAEPFEAAAAFRADLHEVVPGARERQGVRFEKAELESIALCHPEAKIK